MEKYNTTMREDLHKGDKVYVIDTEVDDKIIGNGVIVEIENGKITVELGNDKERRVPYKEGLIFKIAEGLLYKGFAICFEFREHIQYPYFCPQLCKNCGDIYVDFVEIP